MYFWNRVKKWKQTMVSLPHISQGDNHHFPDNDSSNANSEDNISNFFCNNCTQDLALPVRKINPRILRKYEEKYSQIRNMQRLLYQEATTFEVVTELPRSFDVNNTMFQISNTSKETLQIYAFGFPLIQQSQLRHSQSDEFNWERLNEKILRRQSRCQILHKTSQFRDEDKKVQPKYVKKVRRLPSISSYEWERNNNCYSNVKVESSVPCALLRADPEELYFDNFEVGGYYQKKCKITNVSRGKCKFKILPFHEESQFRVLSNTPINTIAAGLSFYITIEFFCRSLADTEDNLIITSKDGENLVVLIKAASVPPYLIEVNDDAYNVDEVVDSYVDCGSHFVGEKSKTTLTLKNIGNAARFCFVAESDWVSLEFSIDPSNTLEAEPFTIQPMYFSLKKDQEITICITVIPPSAGLHTSRVLLLCDNGALNRVDLLCDGFLFEPTLIDHLDMLKTFAVDIQDIVFAECYIDFGRILTSDSEYFCSFLLNTAEVRISYHWELREVSFPGTESLPAIALRIAPMSGRLAPRLSEMFCIRMNTDSIHPGTYRAMLVLVVDDLPKKCVPLNYCDRLLPSDEKDNNKELRSIEAKYIEVWVECVSPSFSLSPYVIDFSDFPLIQGSTIEKREVIIKNESPGKLPLTWKCFEECSSVKLAIHPSKLLCDKYSSFTCTLSVEAVQEGFFELSFWCISDKGDAKIELIVKGSCCKPRLTALTDSIDFGLVKIGSHQTAPLMAKNCTSSDSFQWTLDELYFKSADEGLVAVTDTSSSLSTKGGAFCHRNSEVFVRYELECHEDTLWCSVLHWDGNFIPVTADIQVPDVSLSKYTISANPLYIDVLSCIRVTVSNHSLFNAAVFWGCPMGQETLVTVEMVPRCTVLEPGDQRVTEIMLTPHAVGALENLYIPCFVEGNLQPILLKIEGNVEGLKVRVEWDSEDQHCCVVWPPIEQGLGEENYVLLKSSLCNCPPNSIDVSETSLDAYSLDTHCNILSVNSDFSLTLNSVHEESPIADNFTDDVSCPESIYEENDNTSLASSIPYLNWPIVGGRYTRDPMEEEWESHYNNLFILEELNRDVDNKKFNNLPPHKKPLCFHNMPVRKAVTQTIYIRNDTAIASLYEASVVYSFERTENPDKIPDTEKLLKKVRSEDLDEYVERATRDRGLTVFITPGSGHLMPNDYVILSVTLVANSWGHYSDMIVLQIGDLDHLCVTLSVTVTQPPIIAPQLIRFGSLSPRSPPETRYFDLKNVSTVPVYICWQIFTSSSNNFPFSVMMFDGDPFDLQLTDYYGSCSSLIFQIKEKYTLLEPNSSKTIEVCFYPILVDLEVDIKEFVKTLKAVLVGHIYLTNEARLATNCENCIRVDGSKLSPLRVDLEVVLEVPMLSLLNVYNYELSFSCTAYNVMSTVDKTWSSEKVIRVQNNSRTELNAKVYTVGYFYVTKIEYPCAEEQNRYSKNCITLQPGETCEVTIVCEVTESNLLDCFDPDTEGLDDETLELGSLEHGLICFEQEDVRQDVKLDLWLYPPFLNFSETSLNFGSVYIEDTKMLIINITAPMHEDYFEAFIKTGENGPFSTNVASVILKPKIPYLLQVFFSPKCCTFYQDFLVIRACIDKKFEIPLTGIGTFDYRAHTY